MPQPKQQRLTVAVTGPTGTFGFGLVPRLQSDRRVGRIVGVEDFRSAASVNHILGKVFELTARDRIKPRKAALLAYVGQLLLNSLPAVRLELSYAHALPSLHKAINNLYRKARHRAAVEDFERQISEGDGPVDRVTEVPEFDPAEQPIEPLKISSC